MVCVLKFPWIGNWCKMCVPNKLTCVYKGYDNYDLKTNLFLMNLSDLDSLFSLLLLFKKQYKT